MKRLIFTGLAFYALCCLILVGQVEEPVLTPVPLAEGETQISEQHFRRQLWQKVGADNALRAGLASIAVGLYDRLLSTADFQDVRTHEIQLSRITALIALGEIGAADDALNQFSGPQESKYFLRRSMVSFFAGDRPVAERVADRVVEAELHSNELPWYYLIRGLLDSSSRDPEYENSFLHKARVHAVSPEQRAQLDLIIYRTLLIENGSISQGEINRLIADSEIAIREGKRIGFQFVKEYVIGLYVLGSIEEAVLAIEKTLPRILKADYDIRDELLLLNGILSGANTLQGKGAFQTLLSEGIRIDLRLKALQELVTVAYSGPGIMEFLEFTSGLDQTQLPNELVNQILYNRGQLLYRTKDYETSEAECQKLMENEPDIQLQESTLRLLVLIAFQRQRFRTASGLLIELGDLLADPLERNRIQLLIADCFFQAGDYANAAESYGIAIRQEALDPGMVLFQWVLAEIGTGDLDAARSHMEAHKEDSSIDPVQKWRALWNLLTAMQRSGKEAGAYTLLNEWLTRDAKEILPLELWVRLLWFRCQLSLKTGNYDATPVLAGEVRNALTEAKGRLNPTMGIQIASLAQVDEGQALIFSGRQEEGLELLENVRQDYPSTRAAAQSYLVEARHYASETRIVDAQRRLIELAESYPTSELAPVALYEAALHALTRGTEATQREANLILNRLADNYPEHPLVFYGRLNQGNLLRDFNNFGGAEVVFEQLLARFPQHKERPIVEMAQAECILAQTDTSQARIDQAIGRFERLAELPELPIDLRVEANYKWALSYERRNNPERVMEIYWLAIDQFLIENDQSEQLGSTGRYWMSRIVMALGDTLEVQGDVESARKIYSLIPSRGLPFKNLAEGKLSRLAQKKD